MSMHCPNLLLRWAQLCDKRSYCLFASSPTTFSPRLCCLHTAPSQWLNTAKVLTQICSLETWVSSDVQLCRLHQPDRELLRTVSYSVVFSPQTPSQVSDLHHGLKVLSAYSCSSRLSYFPNTSVTFPPEISVSLIPSWHHLLGGPSIMHAYFSRLTSR